MDMHNKTVIVTGAGRGIGAAAAELCARHGANVLITDINDEWGKTVEKRIRDQGCEATYMRMDVTQEADVEAAVKFAVEKYGRLDGIVNNAATIVVKKVAEVTEEEWDLVQDVNLKGVFFGCKHAIRQFQAQGGGGSIVNIGSISAVVGMPEQPGYCASKGGVYQLSRQIAIDYAKENIRCNIVGPGSVNGEFLQIYLDGQSDPATAGQRIISKHPIGRLADPFEIAEPIMFLLSDRSSFITGANLQVDGGYSTI
jgi:NAD(P)-dependent dehydrogenase (short-subunit alcohol dehydrogenase family)